MVRIALASVVAVALAACIESNPARKSDTSDTATAVDTTPADVGEPCEGAGATRCSAAGDAVEICSGGSWQRTECGDGRICIAFSGAQCLEASGEDPCRSTLLCYLQCGVADASIQDACALDCYLGSTVEAQRTFDAFAKCMERGNCDGLGSVESSLDCITSQCRSPLGQCYFPDSGTDSCASILACYEACNDDGDCQAQCGAGASLDAQGRFAVLELCIYFECAASGDANCLETVTGVGGACTSYARQCLNPL